jgi:hypothetical protein
MACTVCGKTGDIGNCENMPLCFDCYENRSDEVHQALIKYRKSSGCICKGFYQPVFCPVHGKRR